MHISNVYECSLKDKSSQLENYKELSTQKMYLFGSRLPAIAHTIFTIFFFF